MRFISLILLFGLILSSVFGQENENNPGKIGLDRIDASLGYSIMGDWPAILMEKTAGTGVKHIKLVAFWIFMDPSPPNLRQPREQTGYLIVPGLRMPGWHRYYVGGMDLAISEARKYGLEVTIGIHGPPLWPRGADCNYDLGTFHPCGHIKQEMFETFRHALYDFSFYMAERYGSDAKYWILYNEPNLAYSFIPEKPYPGGTLLNAYIDLIYWPMADGLRASGDGIKLVGPEITLLNVESEFGNSRWLEDWIIPILRDYPNHFDVVGIHSYAVDADQTLKKMALVRRVLEQYPRATQRIWLTEFNFGTDKEPLTRKDVFVFRNLLELYSNHWWERSYFFSAMGYLFYDFNDYENFGQEKPLYWFFKIMVQYLN